LLMVTASGQPSPAGKPTTTPAATPAISRLSADDVFPDGAPARYTTNDVFKRVGLAIPEQAELTTRLTAAATADAGFLKAAQAFSTGADPVSSRDLWLTAQALVSAQAQVAEQLEKYLRDQQSGPDAWAAFTVNEQQDLGFMERALLCYATESQATKSADASSPLNGHKIRINLPTIDPVKGLHVDAGMEVTPGVAAANGAGATAPTVTTHVVPEAPNQNTPEGMQVTATVGPTGRSSSIKLAANEALPAMSMEIVPLTAEDKNGPTGDMKCFTLEAHGETLGHLADLINVSPKANTVITVDPAVAGQTVEGKLVAGTVEDLLKQLATLAKLDCRADGEGRWILAPKAVTPSGEGF
ncbi:MAG TPA: hypothetical protein VL860_08205, partial [Planctomycetota bacterium]|nr:hypothetical protein [Planctomycetota bacterium]